MKQTYWIALGRGISPDKPNYPQSLVDSESWRNSLLRQRETPVMIEVVFDPETGTAEANVLKNDPFRKHPLA